MDSTKRPVRAVKATRSVHGVVFRNSRLAAVALAAGMLSLAGAQAAQPAEWAKGRLLVQTRAGLSDVELSKILKAHGGKAQRIGKSDLHVVELPGNASEKAVLAQLAHNPHLKFAELDGLVRPALVSNDPYLGSEWHLNQIGVPAAWNSAQGNGVTIAILDSGVDGTHPDLAARMLPGWNFYDNNSNTTDVYGHGTSVAGAAAASSNNMIGVAGVAGQARILPVRVTDASGAGYFSRIAQGLTWAADQGAKVANVSFLGLTGSSTVVSAAQYMKSKGGLVVVSAGNTGTDPGYPVSTAMIPVSGTDAGDAKASWSSYGNYVAVAAPGADIWTTTVGGGYAAKSGTSFSSPITAGVIGLMMAAKPGLPNTQVESLLYSSSVDLGAAGRDPLFGWGRIDAAKAVQAALNSSAPQIDAQAPVVAIINPGAGTSVSGLVAVDVSASDNIGVSKVELRVNGSLVATDTSAPFGFSWDSTKFANGSASLVATAIDAAGNVGSSTVVVASIANSVDITPPSVAIKSPGDGSAVSGNVSISLEASDNAGSAGIVQTLIIDGKSVATGIGGALTYNWNTRKIASGTHTIQATASDAAGNSKSISIQVSR